MNCAVASFGTNPRNWVKCLAVTITTIVNASNPTLKYGSLRRLRPWVPFRISSSVAILWIIPGQRYFLFGHLDCVGAGMNAKTIEPHSKFIFTSGTLRLVRSNASRNFKIIFTLLKIPVIQNDVFRSLSCLHISSVMTCVFIIEAVAPGALLLLCYR